METEMCICHTFACLYYCVLGVACILHKYGACIHMHACSVYMDMNINLSCRCRRTFTCSICLVCWCVTSMREPSTWHESII